jgi:tetratricopeptide (TPR) repeat protein
MGQIRPQRGFEAGPPGRRAQGLTGVCSTRLGSYLRTLRQGYGYTLRKVEERALAMGEAIDNSQLSRFEKGKAVPSFDKLRALARVFNVPVQSFSDVLELEEYEQLKPDSGEYGELLRRGADWLARGEYGRAFVTYERAVEVAEMQERPDAAERVAEGRWRMATALKKLGKLYMTERELRAILKHRNRISPRIRRRALLQLSFLYRELGDHYLASVLARECLDLARTEGDRVAVAGVLNTLGHIEYDDGAPHRAVESYQEALRILEEEGAHEQMQANVLTSLGGCLVSLGRYEQGVAMLREANHRARAGGFRRVAALSLTRLAEAFRQHGDVREACELLRESDALASRADDPYHDILFLNAFHRWSMARDDGNGTREKIAFGRLRRLRALLQGRFPEVALFDRYIEGARR